MGADVSQALVGSGSYRKINLLTYFREGHVRNEGPLSQGRPLAASLGLSSGLPPFSAFSKTPTHSGTRLSGRPLRISGRATRRQPSSGSLKTATLKWAAVFYISRRPVSDIRSSTL